MNEYQHYACNYIFTDYPASWEKIIELCNDEKKLKNWNNDVNHHGQELILNEKFIDTNWKDVPKLLEIIIAAEKAHHYPKQIIPKLHRNEHDIFWLNEEGKNCGYGYAKQKNNEPHHISLIKCPACNRENYALNVSSGYCTWCPFNANKEI